MGGRNERIPDEIRDFLRLNNKGRTCAEMTEMINAEFGTSFTAAQIKALRFRMHLDSGLTGRFKKGNVPWTAGKKGLMIPGSEKGWFRKGNVPYNQAPVGTEVMTTDGYLKVKIAEPNVWRHKHVMVWEEHNGRVPEGCCIIFKDGDHRNCGIGNLMCVTRVEHSALNRRGLRSADPELTETGLLVARLSVSISRKSRERKTDGEEKI
jgi:hypothetical protein